MDLTIEELKKYREFLMSRYAKEYEALKAKIQDLKVNAEAYDEAGKLKPGYGFNYLEKSLLHVCMPEEEQMLIRR